MQYQTETKEQHGKQITQPAVIRTLNTRLARDALANWIEHTGHGGVCIIRIRIDDKQNYELSPTDNPRKLLTQATM